MPTELEAQLAEYGRWLGRAFELDVRPSRPPIATVAPTESLEVVAPARPLAARRTGIGTPFQRRFLLVGGLAAAAAAGIFALTQGDDSTAPSRPIGIVDSTPESSAPPSTDPLVAPADPSVADGGDGADAQPAPTAPTGETVLYHADDGDAVNELGYCAECDGPDWAPLRTDDGRLILADDENRRWVTVVGGTPTTTPYGDWYLLGQPLTDGDSVFALTVDTDDQRVVLRKFAIDDLATPVDSAEIAGADPSVFGGYFDNVVELANGGVYAYGPEVRGMTSDTPFQAPALLDGYGLDESPQWIELGAGTVIRRWEFAPAWNVLPGSTLNHLPDGRVFFLALAPGDVPHLVELDPDGSAAASDTSDLFGPRAVTASGIVSWEYRDGAFDIVLRPLPSDDPDAVTSGFVTSRDTSWVDGQPPAPPAATSIPAAPVPTTAAATATIAADTTTTAAAVFVPSADQEAAIADCNTFLAVTTEGGGLAWPSGYLAVGDEIAVDQQGAFASDADGFAAASWRTAAGASLGPRLAGLFRTLSNAAVYTQELHDQELALRDSAEFAAICQGW